jgi:transposase
MGRHRHNVNPEQVVKLGRVFTQFPVLREKHRTRKQCLPLVRRFLKALHGQTLSASAEEMAVMWRFTRNNSITEGFHTKMELVQRQAYGFHNFNNYRLRVKIMCS